MAPVEAPTGAAASKLNSPRPGELARRGGIVLKSLTAPIREKGRARTKL